MEAAKQVTADNVASLPDDGLNAYLAALHEAGEELPISVSGALVSMHVGKLVTLAEHSISCFDKFVDAERPWPSSVPIVFDQTDVTTWKLSALSGLSAKAKCDRYMSTMFNKFFVPLIDGGQPKAIQVSAFATANIEAWELEQDVDADDTTVATMVMALRCFRFMLCLTEMQINTLSADTWEIIDYVSKVHNTAGTGPGVLVAVRVNEDPFYKERLQQFLKARTVIELHGDSLQKDIEFVGTLNGDWDRIDQVMQVLKNICVYIGELDDVFSEPIVQLALGNVKDIIKTGLQALGGIEESSELFRKLQAPGSEASLVFSLDADIAELSDMISMEVGKDRQETMQASCALICNRLADAADDDAMREIVTDQLMLCWHAHVGFDATSDSAIEATVRAQKSLIHVGAININANTIEWQTKPPSWMLPWPSRAGCFQDLQIVACPTGGMRCSTGSRPSSAS